VVDDEPTVCMLVTEVLEDLGYTSIEATDGAAGLKCCNPTCASTCWSQTSACRAA
jgi:CheY-like chemotaxis protein